MVQVYGFACPFSGAVRKCFRIAGLVSCPGFRFAISPVFIRRTFARVSGFRRLFRVSCLGLGLG